MRHPPNLKVVGSNLSPKFTDDLNRNDNYISVRSFILTGAPYPSIEEAVKDILSPKDGTGIFSASGRLACPYIFPRPRALGRSLSARFPAYVF